MNRRTAVITGASGGIGMELARLFAADKYDLIITARSVERLRLLADELAEAYGVAVHVIGMDIAQPHAAAALWQAIGGIAAHVDVLVNNAGVGDAGDFAGEDAPAIECMIHLNISTLTLLTRLALPGMLARKHGRILNVASAAGFQPGGPGMAVYYASKSYVLSFSRAIRRELRGSGVSVTTLCPGPTSTGFEQAAHTQHMLLFRWKKPMTAAAVALIGYKGMRQGRGVIVPGLLNKLMAFGPRIDFAGIALEVNRMLLRKTP
ncbi:MAG: SDR family oxidoreductase [Pseudomonadota bacterium]